MSFETGDIVGNYEVVERIGVGGMGAVYLARHPLLGKQVALKVIHRDLAANGDIVTRFFNEAKALNKIGNPHIVDVLDFGEAATGEYFFIMEYLDGKTLAELLKEGALPEARAVHIAGQIANGLAAAHEQGLLHRDLKPDNVMVGKRDFVKVLDFGLAKAFLSQDMSQLTATGVLMGTPQYMSPEACLSEPKIDQRADVYSLGILLYQMLNGKLPFDSPATGAILVMHVEEEVPRLDASISPLIAEIVYRCLHKDPSQRFQSMEALQQALLSSGQGQSTTIIASAAVPIPVTAPPSIPHSTSPQWGDGPREDPSRALSIDTRGGKRIGLIFGAIALITVGAVALLYSRSHGTSSHSGSSASQQSTSKSKRSRNKSKSVKSSSSSAVAQMPRTTISVESIPTGASVIDEDGKVLIEATPGTFEVDASEERFAITLRHPSSDSRTRVIPVSKDIHIFVELPPAKPVSSTKSKRSSISSSRRSVSNQSRSSRRFKTSSSKSSHDTVNPFE